MRLHEAQQAEWRRANARLERAQREFLTARADFIRAIVTASMAMTHLEDAREWLECDTEDAS